MKKIIILTLFALLYFTACSNDSNTNISENINVNTNEIKNNTYSNEIVRVGIYVYDYPMLYLSNDTIGGFGNSWREQKTYFSVLMLMSKFYLRYLYVA